MLVFRKYTFTETWTFSCSLVPNKCKFSTSSIRGLIEATLVKDCDYFNCGPSALPLRLIDDSELTPFGSTQDMAEYFNSFPLRNYIFYFKVDYDLKHEAAANETVVTDPFYCLRQTILTIWDTAMNFPKVVDWSIQHLG